jgi:hypothetical protein
MQAPAVELERALEEGELLIAIRPRVDLPGVQRLFVMLSPDVRPVHRRIVIGKKRMPRADRHEKEWAYVDRVAEGRSELFADLGPKTYETKTRGVRHLGSARVVSEGRYVIAAHGDHAHLRYDVDDARPEIALVPRGDLIVTVFNPLAKGPRSPGTPFTEPSIFPDELQERFGDRRLAPLAPELLDYEGAELVLIACDQKTENLGATPSSAP